MILVNLRKQDERKETNEKYQEVEDAEEEIIAEEDDNLTAVNQKHSEKRDSAPVTNQESDKRTKNNKRQANESPNIKQPKIRNQARRSLLENLIPRILKQRPLRMNFS